MDVANFTPLASAIGGILVGISASAMLLLNGRIAGVSGILAGVLKPVRSDTAWRAMFVAGLVTAGAVGSALHPAAFAIAVGRSPAAFVVAGLLVGFGTRLGNGCTSGHGVCGISRGSRRSLAATATFMVTGAATVYVVNHLMK
jgi:uncharacterized membrane protein YedE/YeeE